MSTRTAALPFGVQRTIQKQPRDRPGEVVRSTLANIAMKVRGVFSAVSDTQRGILPSRSVSMSCGRSVCSAGESDDELPCVHRPQRASDVWRLLQDDPEAVWHFQVNYPHLLRLEQQAASVPKFDVKALTADQEEARWHMVDWIIRSHEESELSHLTLFLAVQILDRSLAVCWVPEEKSRKLAATALLLAAKYQDERYPDHQALEQCAEGHFVAEELHFAELEMLMQIDHNFHDPTAAHHLYWFLKLCDSDTMEGSEQHNLALYLADVGLYSSGSCRWLPTQYAAAVVFLSNLLLSKTSWPHAFERVVVGGDEERRDNVKTIAADLLRVLAKSKPGDAAYDIHEEDLHTASAAVELAKKSMGPNWSPLQKN